MRLVKDTRLWYHHYQIVYAPYTRVNYPRWRIRKQRQQMFCAITEWKTFPVDVKSVGREMYHLPYRFTHLLYKHQATIGRQVPQWELNVKASRSLMIRLLLYCKCRLWWQFQKSTEWFVLRRVIRRKDSAADQGWLIWSRLSTESRAERWKKIYFLVWIKRTDLVRWVGFQCYVNVNCHDLHFDKLLRNTRTEKGNNSDLGEKQKISNNFSSVVFLNLITIQIFMYIFRLNWIYSSMIRFALNSTS